MASDAIVPARSAAPSPIESLHQLAASGQLSPESLERLLGMHERILDRDARMAFHEAMAAFRAEVPPAPRVSKGAVRQDGTKTTTIMFSDFAVLTEHIRPYVAKHGLSYRFETDIDAETTKITCVVAHVLGHEERSSFVCKTKDAAPPRANGVQISGSAMSYGMRYSLIAALGLATALPDDDGASAGGGAPVETITAAQAADLHALATEVGVDERKFLAWLGGYSLYTEIPADEYGRAVEALERKRGGA